MRIVLATTLALTLAAVSGPVASARGVQPRGTLLAKNVSVSNFTGSCGCLDRWYTLQAEPGKFQVQAHVTQVGRAPSGTYGILMYLIQGATVLMTAQFGCFVHSHCSNVARLTYKVSKPEVLYLKVTGPGALSLKYKLVATGSVGRLRCTNVC